MALLTDKPNLAPLATNPQVASLPNHLLQFAVDQNYNAYHPVDHAVWRYIMRQNCHFLRENAHKVYFKGLLETGIDLDKIPSIEEMNRILGQIGWGAVAVDGFIPPVAFMEYQAYRVLVIACDMRQLHHIEYTPAPDIVHEAAGHAPIIVDAEYSNYLQRFGEIGAKAISSKKDYELYEAIRLLSILKENPNSTKAQLDSAEQAVIEKQKNLGEPSEMALISRLHWWTVEYGLIGTLEKPKIYGAGLLSSIGESVSCLESDVKKIPYTLDAMNFPFDITTQQPQLFVTPDFAHLMQVLEQFADRMAYRCGGREGLKKAIESHATATVVYSSGLQCSGILTSMKTDRSGNPSFVKFSSPVTLAHEDKLLPGHGLDYHKDGFSSPIGKFKNVPRSPELLDDSALAMCGVSIGKLGRLEFESGIVVEGTPRTFLRRNGKLLLITFDQCTVTLGSEILFRPEWGPYDMAVGETISSVFSGAADKDAHDQIAPVSKTRTIKVLYDEKSRQLQKLYGEVRNLRDAFDSHQQTANAESHLQSIWKELTSHHPEDWLLATELLELSRTRVPLPGFEATIRAYLEGKMAAEPNLVKLIEDGIRLADRASAK